MTIHINEQPARANRERAREISWIQTNGEIQREARQPTAIYIERSVASVEQQSKNPKI